MATSARSHPRLALTAGGAGGGDDGGQRLRMSAALKQAIRLLQLTRLELIEEIRKDMRRQ